MKSLTLTFLLLFLTNLSHAQLGLRNPEWLGSLYQNSCPGITFRGIGQTNTTAGATSYTVATSNAPSANALVLVAVINSKASAPDTPTLTGHGMTWVQVLTTNFNVLATPIARLTVFRGMTNNTPTATALVADFAGATQTGCNIRAVNCSNALSTGSHGANAVIQAVANGANASANPSITLAALNSSGRNNVVAFFGNDSNGFAGTAENNWVEDWDSGYNTPATGGYCVYRLATTDNTVVVTAGSGDWAGIAIEVAPNACP
jgi:hypothetical protein